MERDGKTAFTDLTERAFLIRQTDILRTLTSADCLASTSFYMPADGVLAAYKRISAPPAAPVELKTTIVSDAPKRCAMSAIGTKRTVLIASAMSAFGGKA